MIDASDVIAVILTYNRKKLLCEVLNAVLAQDSGSPHILIIDNHSTDGTREAIEPYLKLDNIDYADTGSNLGGTGGFHFGIKKAALMHYARLWIMDDDCIPERSALSALIQADRRMAGEFGWMSSAAYWTDGGLCKMNLQRTAYWRRLKSLKGEPIRVQFASFVSLYLPVCIVREMGLPIADFFIWADDWELTRRISKKYQCFVVPESHVLHKTAHNHGVDIIRDSGDRNWRYRYNYRNEVYVMRREGLRGRLFFCLKIFYHTGKVLLYSRGERLKKLRVIYGGIGEGFRFHPEMAYVPLEAEAEEGDCPFLRRG